MSFFRILISNFKHFKEKVVSPGKSLLNQILGFFSYKTGKRISFISFLREKKIKASMAVEAAIAIPFFLFFLMNILFAFDMLRLHGNIMGAMHQAGNKIAFYGYAYRSGFGEEGLLSGEADSLILSEGYARRKVINILGEDYLNHTCLASGTSGLHFIKSSVMKEDDRIELVASYKVKPFINIIGFPDMPMENRYYGRAWTGYDVACRAGGGEGEDPVVYIAETGTVYHIARNCAYLNPSVEAVSKAMASELRNEGGGKYYSCGSCKGNNFQPVVYITSYGNRIHSSLSCSGLKRTVYTVHLSEVKGKGKCSKCGG
jgi:hypothetical protein